MSEQNIPIPPGLTNTIREQMGQEADAVAPTQSASEHRCETCGAAVTVQGKTTLHYEPVAEMPSETVAASRFEAALREVEKLQAKFKISQDILAEVIDQRDALIQEGATPSAAVARVQALESVAKAALSRILRVEIMPCDSCEGVGAREQARQMQIVAYDALAALSEKEKTDA